MKKIDFYLLKEMTPPTILGIFIFTIIVIAQRLFKISDYIIAGGVPPLEIFRLIFYSLPAFLEISIPVSVVLGVTVAFSRLSIDGEITALRSSGYRLSRLLPAVTIFSLIAFVVVSYLTIYGSSKGYENLYSTLRRISYYGSREIIKEGVFTKLSDSTLIYVDHITPGEDELRGVVISEKRDIKEPIIITAASGETARSESGLILKSGVMVQNLKGEEVHRVVSFENLRLNIDGKGGAGTSRSRKPKEIPLPRLVKLTMSGSVPDYRLPSFIFSINKRISLPFACIVFALFAVPAGMSQRSRSRSSSFLVTGGIVFSYYLFFGIAQSVKGFSLPLSIAILWLPNLIFTLITMIIIHKMEQDPRFSERFGRFKWRKG